MAETTLTTRGDAATPSRGWLWPALSAVLALALLALGLTWWLTRPPAEGSAEVTFARDMIAHHDQAIELAVITRDRITDAQLRTIMLDIVLTQTSQVGQMEAWLNLWGRPLTGPRPPMAGMAPQMGMATQQEMNQLRDLPPAEAEVWFLQLMIRHHQGGVFMAEDVLKQTRDPHVTRLAQSIVDAQTSEITAMTALLQARGAEPLPPLPRMEH